MCRNSAGDALWTCNGNPLRRHAINRKKHPKCNSQCPGNSILAARPAGFRYQLRTKPDGTFEDPGRESDGDDDDMDVHGNSGDSDDMDIDAPRLHQEQSPVLDTRIPSLRDASQSTSGQPHMSTAATQGPTSRETSQSHAGSSREPMTTIVPSRSGSQSSDDHHVVDLNVDDIQNPNEKKPSTSTETFRLLYVPDPTRCATASRAQNDLAFLLTTISNIEWNQVKHLEGSIHLKSRISHTTTETTVWMQEWVY